MGKGTSPSPAHIVLPLELYTIPAKTKRSSLDDMKVKKKGDKTQKKRKRWKIMMSNGKKKGCKGV